MSEKKTPNDLNSPFKDKEKGGDEGRSKLNGQWKVPMISDQWKEKEKHFFTSFHFPSNKFYLNLHFFF
jgi:hypothetical protein